MTQPALFRQPDERVHLRCVNGHVWAEAIVRYGAWWCGAVENIPKVPYCPVCQAEPPQQIDRVEPVESQQPQTQERT